MTTQTTTPGILPLAFAWATRLAETIAGRIRPNMNFRFLSQSILLEEAGPPKAMAFLVTVIVSMILAFLAWAALTHFSEVAATTGQVVPSGSVQPVMHLEGGIVDDILVHDGQSVAAGQVLVKIQGAQAGADLDRARARYQGLALEVERLRAFALGREPKLQTQDAAFAGMAEDQREIYQTQVKAREASRAVLAAQVSSRRKELAGFVEQEQTLVKQTELARQQLAMREELVQKGLVSRITYLDSQRMANQALADLQNVRSRQAQTTVDITEAESRLLDLDAKLRNDALAQMGERSTEMAQVQEEIARQQDRVQRLEIRAPSDGVVKGLTVKSAGAVIQPGAVVAEIVPVKSVMEAEVRISPRDIGHVHPGSDVIVKIASYDASKFGTLRGKVTNVSASSFMDDKGQPYFKGMIQLDKGYVGNDPNANRVTPGMTLTADIQTGQKSLLGYLVRPVYNAMTQSFHER